MSEPLPQASTETSVPAVLLENALQSTPAHCPSLAWMETWIAHAHADIVSGARAELSAPTEVSVLLVEPEQMQQLNRDFRGVDRPTNVLSFPADLPGLGGETDRPTLAGLPDFVQPLGDIVLCASVVAAEAHAQDKAVAHHWAHLLIHGFLHLHGYDHESDEEAETMESAEIRILSRDGIPNPYLSSQAQDGPQPR